MGTESPQVVPNKGLEDLLYVNDFDKIMIEGKGTTTCPRYGINQSFSRVYLVLDEPTKSLAWDIDQAEQHIKRIQDAIAVLRQAQNGRGERNQNSHD